MWWRKAKHKVALHHEHIFNKRRDFIGKLVYKLFHHQKNNVVIAEALNVSNMVKNKHLSKSISDGSWATFFDWCANMVSERDGLHFHQVVQRTLRKHALTVEKKPKRYFLSQYELSTAGTCGYTLDKDHNAAKNILQRAAAALRGERWVTNLNEARNKNEATKAMENKNDIQISLFETLNNPNAFRLG